MFGVVGLRLCGEEGRGGVTVTESRTTLGFRAHTTSSQENVTLNPKPYKSISPKC